jgi:hypothetical protein
VSLLFMMTAHGVTGIGVSDGNSMGMSVGKVVAVRMSVAGMM